RCRPRSRSRHGPSPRVSGEREGARRSRGRRGGEVSRRVAIALATSTHLTRAPGARPLPRKRAERARSPMLSEILLLPREERLALLHEGAAAFDVIGAVEAALHQRLAMSAVDLLWRLHELAHHAFHRLDGERRIL